MAEALKYQEAAPIAGLPERRAIDRIIHIQIEKNGALAFGAYDSFHPDCIVAGPGVPVALLEQLQASGVIRSYELATP